MKKNLFYISALLFIAGGLGFLAARAYLGSFTRYMADDYCETYTTHAYSPLGAVLIRYREGNWRAANRYSNLLFVGIVEWIFGLKSVEIIPVVMMILWTLGVIYLVRRARILTGIQWPDFVDMFFGVSIAFFAILEAPNPYQTFYWRSSMATHFVPLVFLNFLVGFVLFKFNSGKKISIITFLLVLFSAFMIGGFSEPPVTLMVVGAGLGLAGIWFLIRDQTLRRSMLVLTGAIFLGAVSALTVMAVSPAVANMSHDAPSFINWVLRTAQYTYLFIVDTFRTLPLPIFISFLCSILAGYLIYHQNGMTELNNGSLRRTLALTLPVILVILIAAGFSTSAYGQSYPVSRARFFAHYLMTITLMVEGGLFGVWLSQIKSSLIQSAIAKAFPVLILALTAIYPFRAALRLMQDVPAYTVRAQNWDRRDAHIYQLRDNGVINLTVPQFDGVDGVKELDSYNTHWVNRCASKYYVVGSIRAIPIHGTKDLEDYYNSGK